MIVPMVIGLAAWRGRAGRRPGAECDGVTTGTRTKRLRSAVPVFIVWFLVAVALNTVGLVPTDWHAALSAVAAFMITMALAAIGLSTRSREIRSAGFRPLVLGATLWILVTGTSLGLQALTGTHS